MGFSIMRKNIGSYIIVLSVFYLISCSVNVNRTFDIIMYDNQQYAPIDTSNVLIVSSRLEIKKKYFEIGVIKATVQTNIKFIKEVAAKNGAEIIITEGNLNYTLARYKNGKNKGKDKNEIIKT